MPGEGGDGGANATVTGHSVNNAGVPLSHVCFLALFVAETILRVVSRLFAGGRRVTPGTIYSSLKATSDRVSTSVHVRVPLQLGRKVKVGVIAASLHSICYEDTHLPLILLLQTFHKNGWSEKRIYLLYKIPYHDGVIHTHTLSSRTLVSLSLPSPILWHVALSGLLSFFLSYFSI